MAGSLRPAARLGRYRSDAVGGVGRLDLDVTEPVDPGESKLHSRISRVTDPHSGHGGRGWCNDARVRLPTAAR